MTKHINALRNATFDKQSPHAKVEAIFTQPQRATRYSDFAVICTHPWAMMGGNMDSKQQKGKSREGPHPVNECWLDD